MSERSDEIVVGIDGSESSIAALRSAKQLAEALHRPVRGVIAWHWPYLFGGAPAEWDAAADAHALAEDAVLQVWGRGDAIPIDVAQGAAASVLIEASDGASMLVLGSRGHGGFAGLLLGSVSTACAEHARCPVLVVRGPDQNEGRPA